MTCRSLRRPLRHIRSFCHFLVLPLSLVLLGPAQAEDAPAATAAAPGQEVAAQVCAACHNPDGNSTIVENPKLAGQHANYLYKQLKNFKMEGDKPAERTSAIMNGMVAILSEQDMKNVAAWYASQTQAAGHAKADTLQMAEKLYRAGDFARGIPACAACHGAAGAGIPDQYPRIAGQHTEYTEAQLKLFRSGERSNDPNRMMRSVTAWMTDVEIQALADYIAGLR